MPASQRSLQITDIYRDRISRLADRLAGLVGYQWAAVDVADLPRTHATWLAAASVMVEHAQAAGVHLTSAYLAAFVAAETGRPVAAVQPVDTAAYVGRAENGQPLAEQLAGTLIAVRASLKDGQPPADALAEQGRRVSRLTASASAHAPRAALADQITAHPEIIGWKRVTHGGCGACLASAARGYAKDEPMLVHPHCHCTQEPVIAGVPDLAPRPTGPEIFHAMSPEQQDRALGPDVAQLVRQGRVAWPDLIARSPMETQADYITQAIVAGVEG